MDAQVAGENPARRAPNAYAHAVHRDSYTDPPPHGDGVVEVPIEATATLPMVPEQATGEDLPARTASVTLPPGLALLVVRHGPNMGARFLLDRDVVVAGRQPDSDIFLDDVTVSRQHAEFRRTASGGFAIVDTGSLNGTYVNRQRLAEATLRSGDEVQIGKFRMTFLMGEVGQGH